MHRQRVLIILLARKAPQNDCTSFVVAVFPCDWHPVGQECHGARSFVLQLKLFLKPCRLELCGAPLHVTRFFWNHLLLAHPEHLIPSKAWDLGLSMAALIDPAGACFNKKMSAVGNVF